MPNIAGFFGIFLFLCFRGIFSNLPVFSRAFPCNIGKSVELFGLCQPGLRFVNPVNGVMTQLPATADRALWLVTGDVYAFDNQHGFAFVRAEHLMPLTPDEAPQMLDELAIG